jgi:Subtilase family.
MCYGGADGVAALLDPAKVAGKILVCDRGGNVLVNKVQNASNAGAAGVIILNRPAEGAVGASADTTPLITGVLPTVHLMAANFTTVTTEARKPDGTASFAGSFLVPGVVAPVMAQTSSRGPSLADPDILKPDITAPGTDIIAAYTNTSITAEQRAQIIAGTLIPGPGADMISGTSMASPHVAGAAALLKQANPTWSPFAIKSALLTSALQTVKLANGATDANRWGYGSGHLNPNDALSTKVVYDSSPQDYVNYYVGAISARELNLPTLTYANVVGSGKLTRKLTNRGSSSATYNVSASLPGYTVTIAPSTLTLAPGETKSYTVTLMRNGAPLSTYLFGEVVWTSNDGSPAIRSPLTAKAESLVAISSVTDTRNAGSKVITIGTGYDGAFKATATGLVPATRASSTIATNQRLCLPFVVPAGAKMLRAQLFNSETGGGSASDLDLVVLRGATTVGSSGGGSSDELVSIVNPTAATNYQVCVDGYAPVNGSATFTINLWVIPATVTPATLRAVGPTVAYTGGTASVAMSWNVAAGARYLGVVEYTSPPATTVLGRTSLFIDNVASAPAATVSRDKTPF